MTGYTEGQIIDRLRQRYTVFGVTGTRRFVHAAHVRHSPANPQSIADFLVLDTWGNYGPENARHPVLGFEVKVSRSDYLREIRDLGKSAPFRAVCTEWYIVASEPGVVRGDLPLGWGLMVANSSGLRCVTPSALNPDPLPMPRGLIAGFMRAAVTQAVAS